ncbi:hypothetical protein PR202_ga28233 [Eleusine coracana subsp. coracana]|uniref:O-methyltransferase C-terminal domain-containing protein n=1 Tax=Eleusine coracana subsp. coracana TaxID=191504 RepID=A0AAV5DH63_ELECO|nr:hypothetical protein PR202_ga28233 [Eleusine coracana subsp. coracana]
MHTWLKDEEQASTKSFFEITHGCGRFEMTKKDANDNAMVAGSQITMEIILREAGRDIFEGLSSLVDVGGGHGAASAAIAAAFPHIKCRDLDLPHVVDKAPADGTVQFIAGDMFKFMPKADAVLLKALWDLYMMHLNGVERDERGWEKIIREAGFRDYKVISVPGIFPVIEIYP